MSYDFVVTVKDVSYWYGVNELRQQILFNIHLQVAPGEIVILTGPSGSGKTTLLTLIGALRSVQSGRVIVCGQELYRANADVLHKIRRNIGYVFQSHNLLRFLTAQQNVQMALQLNASISSKAAQARSKDILKAVGLGAQCEHYPDQLSIGQKQRVAVARALVGCPSLVLADEPTASLDSKAGRDVVDILNRLAKEQKSAILLVTHDTRVFDIAHRILYMEDGRLKIPAELTA